MVQYRSAHIDDPSPLMTKTEDLKDIARRAMLEHGLQPDFGEPALDQAGAMRTPHDASPAIRDLRDLPWFSIDNDDSRDLDQLSVGQGKGDGTINVLVAIADVDAAVAKDTAIDAHAKANTTSIYTAARIFPMLPERLSTDLTSLVESEERLAIVIDMTFSREGEVMASAIYRARVLNHEKLAYDSVAAWLDGQGSAPARLATVAGLDSQLRLQDEVARAMKELRSRSGALSLETIEARPVFTNGTLTDLRPDTRNRAKDLIEQLMVASNGVVAAFLDAAGNASIHRVLHTPERWSRIVALAASVNERLPATPDAIALEALLEKRRATDPEHFADFSLSVVKLLGSGEYAVSSPGDKPVGHFGLAMTNYTHSTAPNRRFVDLVTQRLLKAALVKTPSPYSLEELTEIAAHCNVQQTMAEKVERQVRKSAAALLLASRIGETFDAIVTGASDKGTWVRVRRPVVEGRVTQDFAGLDVGDAVRVALLHVDPARGFIDFKRVR